MNPPPIAMTRILLGSSGANAMLEPLQLYGHDVVVADFTRLAAAQVRALLQSFEVVLIDVTLASRAILATIHDLSAVIGTCDVAPRLLCFSTARHNSQFVLDVEKCGAKYARIADPPMLFEAIDLLLADIEELRRNGLYLEVLHGFARGGCAPGETVKAWLYPRAAKDPQLQLGHQRAACSESLGGASSRRSRCPADRGGFARRMVLS